MGKLIFTTGDYIKNSLGMDAIVDAQNKYMGVGGNICGLILFAAGKQKLLDYCKDNYKENMYPSEVRITPGFNLKMDIIHVLAPIAYEEKEPLKMMRETYLNLVNNIKNKSYKKVLCCSLGTGSHRYNPSDIANDAVNILNNFCKVNDVEIYFNNMYPRQKEIYLKEYIKINNIDLLKIRDTTEKDTYKFLKEYSLCDININENFENFIKGNKIEEMCLAGKLLYLQYILEMKKDKNIFSELKEKIVEDYMLIKL